MSRPEGESRRRVMVYGPGYAGYGVEEAILRPFGVERVTGVDPLDPRAGEMLAEADAILVREARMDSALLARLARCRIIARYGVGVDNIDLAAAAERRIYVTNVPSYGTDEVATHALALLLAVLRDLPRRERELRAGRWGGPQRPRRRLRDFVLGLVGFGRIARSFREKLLPFAPRVTLVHDPAPTEPLPPGTEPVDLDTLCREADVVSLHAPYRPETHHLLDRRRITLLKPNAIVINTARGGLVDGIALAEALAAGRIAGAGLDVLEREPPDPDHPLLRLDNVVLSDHNGWYSEDSQAELQAAAAREIARVFAGDEPLSWVNRWEA